MRVPSAKSTTMFKAGLPVAHLICPRTSHPPYVPGAPVAHSLRAEELAAGGEWDGAGNEDGRFLLINVVEGKEDITDHRFVASASWPSNCTCAHKPPMNL